MTKNQKGLSGWRGDENDHPQLKPTNDFSSSTVSPVTFHKASKRLEVMNSAEKRDISNEVQKIKHENDIKLKVFRQITCYRKWPLQELAFKDLDALMEAHLNSRIEGNYIQNLTSDGPIDTNPGTKEWEDASHTSELSAQSLEEPKRPRSMYVDMASSSPNKLQKEKIKKEFQADVAILPRSQDDPGSEVQPFLPPLWCMEPRSFAVEKSTTGKRYYVVAHLGRFMDHYWRSCHPTSRHYYEVIRENTPCRLYFGE